MLHRSPKKKWMRCLLLAGTTLAGGFSAAPTAALDAEGRDVTGICDNNPRKDKGRPLTSGESKLLRFIFNKEVDVKGVRIHNEIYEDANITAYVKVGDPCNIVMSHFYLHNVDDFSKASNIDFIHVFVHEATHLWHYGIDPEHRPAWTPYSYDYTVSKTSEFSDYEIEAQAEIIGDFTRILSGAPPRERLSPVGAPEDIKRIVENKFPWTKTATPPRLGPH